MANFRLILREEQEKERRPPRMFQDGRIINND